MQKQILVVGGGISGLAVLHYLKKKYASRTDVQIKLLEKSTNPGGTIQSIRQNQFLFECGPNGFLSSKPNTLEFIKELELEKSLLAAKKESKERFILLNGILHRIPLDPLSFFTFKPLSISDKFRIFKEIFIAQGNDPNETVYDFGKRRLGERFAELFLDPMVSGVFGGDARKLNLKSAFPRIYEIEQTYGSLFRGMFHLAMRKRSNAVERRINVGPKGTLMSFENGMGELTDTLYSKYKDSIYLNEEVGFIKKANNRFIVQTNQREYSCDEIFICTPAYSAAQILYEFNKVLTEELRKISYASIAVIGLVYKRDAFSVLPKGFGYLIPTKEGKAVLGVLFSSNIFENRTDENHILF